MFLVGYFYNEIIIIWKKNCIISEEEYERSKGNPTKREFFESEKQMKDVLNGSEIANDEEIRFFTENLNSMKKQYDDLIKPKQVQVVRNQQKEPQESTVREESLESKPSLENSLIKSPPN